MIFDLATEVRRLNTIGEPLLYRIGLAGLISRYGLNSVRRAFVDDAARMGAVSIASAPGWCHMAVGAPSDFTNGFSKSGGSV
jgi:hypothetical protein